jgi:capsular polysaccharide biosynthesis protein
LANVQTNFNTFSQQLAQLSTGAQGLFHEIDAPKVPTQPESRVKSLLVGGAVGLVIGLLAAIGYFLILVRLDQSVYSSADMPAITDYPVLIQIQKLPRRSATWITRTNGKLITEKGA